MATDISSLYESLAHRAAQDPDFHARLLADPAAALADLGVEQPPGVRLRMVENTPTVKHFILPPRPNLPAATRWSAEDATNAYGKVVARAWTEPDFRERLLSDPRTALQECGLEIPAGVDIRVVERTADTAWLVLPEPR